MQMNVNWQTSIDLETSDPRWYFPRSTIVGTPPPPGLKGGGPSENVVTWGGGGQNFLLERVDKPEKEGLM